MKRVLAAALLTLVVAPQVAIAQEPAARVPAPQQLIAAFDSIVPQQMNSSHIPGAVLIIVKDGQIYASRGWGVSNLQTRDSVTTDRSIFRIGSISKVFTAMAAMQQVERGRLSLSTDVNSYFKLWKVATSYAQPITLEHLLTHTAGLDEISSGRKVFEPSKVIPLEVFLRERIIRRRAPGLMSSYSTYGISLAGHLVEVVSGMPMSTYFEREVFAPLGMISSSYGAPRTANGAAAVTGYDFQRDYRAEPWEYFHTGPASDINVTATDMAKFMIAHLEGSSALGQTARQNMHTVHFRNDPRIRGMAYGFFEQRMNGYRALYHGGTMGGFKASLWLWPDQRMGLFLAYNREVDDLERRVLNRFAARALLPKLDAADAEGVTWNKPRVRGDLARFVGQYRQDTWCHTCKTDRGYQPTAFDVKVKNDSTITFWGGEWAQVEPMLFRIMNGSLDFGQMYVAFRADSTGRVIGMAAGGPWFNEKESGGAAAPPKAVAVSISTLQRYVGAYDVPGLGQIAVALTGDRFEVEFGGRRAALIAQSSDRFVAAEFNAELLFKQRALRSKVTEVVVRRPGQPDVTARRID
jgi:CubicO group peptidase (beta-lactamase class C family)